MEIINYICLTVGSLSLISIISVAIYALAVETIKMFREEKDIPTKILLASITFLGLSVLTFIVANIVRNHVQMF